MQQQRIERPALTVQDHLHGFFVGVGFFVAAVAGQCIVHIGQRDQLCADGDLIALQPIRIAAAIPAFVVPAGDLVGGLQQRLLGKIFQTVQHFGTPHTVGLDQLKFLRGQPAGFVEHLFVNGDLANVVQGRGQRDMILLLRRLLEISSRYSISAEQQDMIPLASALHHIGKIGIDEKILNKPGRLTPEEFEVMKTHSMLGAKMLHDLDNFAEQPLLQTAYEIARWHHERWDGRGYPDGLKGDEIPISAQLVSLADVYDALTSERCYKKAFSHEKAVQMILNSECGAFNPLLLQCLTDIQADLKEELQQHT